MVILHELLGPGKGDVNEARLFAILFLEFDGSRV